MEFTNSTARFHVPDGVPEEAALARITHLGIGAHQDDLEFMAFHGILCCVDSDEKWFGGVTCTDGAGSARTGQYASYSDEEMQAVRKQEQGDRGRPGPVRGHDPARICQPGHEGSRLHGSGRPTWRPSCGRRVPRWCTRTIPADKHDTHVAVVASTLRALRMLPASERPRQVLGCEVWRDLDWMMDSGQGGPRRRRQRLAGRGPERGVCLADCRRQAI